MITAHDEESLINAIKGLSELEFAAILKQMAEHLRRNDWEHIIDECFEIETFKVELEEMIEAKERMFVRAREAEQIIKKIKDLL